jgi:outer membrane protein assembly factor BamB
VQTSHPHRASARRAQPTIALSIGVLALLCVWTGAALAQAAAGWTQFQGGAARTGATADGPEPGFRQRWRTPVAPGGPDDRFGLSAPVIADTVAVVVGPEQVLGIDLASGEESFTVARDLGPSVPAAIATVDGAIAIVYTEGWGDGPPVAPGADETSTAPTSATPTPSPSSTGAGDDDGAEGHLAAIDIGDQRPLWPPVPLDGVSRTGVTVLDGTAFVGVNDGTVTAVDLARGTVAWQQQLGGQLATPLAATDGLVFVGLQGDRDTQPVIIALDAATGEERWRHEPQAPSALVSAVSAGDGSIFAVFTGLSETSVVAIDLADGTERWSRRAGGTIDPSAPPVVSDDAVYLTDLAGHTRALDTATGEDRWDFASNTLVLRGAPILVGSTLLVPAVDGEIDAIDVSSGRLVWRRAADDAPVRALASSGEFLVAVRGGVRSGIEAYEHDPDVTLLQEASPTTLALGRMLGAMAIATVPLIAAVVLLGAWLARRMGPAFPEEPGDDADDGEPIRDPWEDEEPSP